ncbi:MAG: hypothetical protein KHX00_00520 [Bacteroides sp.]|nr:hypothetical protein [Bacteroides sp.]
MESSSWNPGAFERHRDFLILSGSHLASGIFDTKIRSTGTTASAASLGCTANIRQPSAICAKLGIPSVSLHPHLPDVPRGTP